MYTFYLFSLSLEDAHSLPTLLRVFNKNECWILKKKKSLHYWDDYSPLIRWIILIDFWMLKRPCISKINPIWLGLLNPFLHVLLFDLLNFKKFCFCVNEGYWSTVLGFFLFNFYSNLWENWYNSFLRCLLEFTICAWRFPCGKVFN